MIQPHELRLGNYVYSTNHKQVFKITQLSFDEPILDKPIPITEDELIKLGYELLVDNSGNIFFSTKGHLIWKCTNDLFMCEKNGVVLKHVHRLQNLYYELNNKELTYKE